MTAERILWAVGALFVLAFVGLAWSIAHAYSVRHAERRRFLDAVERIGDEGRRRLKIMLGDQR